MTLGVLAAYRNNGIGMLFLCNLALVSIVITAVCGALFKQLFHCSTISIVSFVAYPSLRRVYVAESGGRDAPSAQRPSD